MIAATFKDGWEAAFNLLAGDPRKVQAHMIDALKAHTFQECTADLISGCEISPMQFTDRTVPRCVHQTSTFAAHCL